MKLLTVTIPCYNSAAYMSHAIDSLLPAGEDLEIIIVDDGSTKDNTLEIAKQYEQKYPTIVRAIHQENGGHGEAVNTGIANASGIYFKVIDSDDWADDVSLMKVMNFLRSVVTGGKSLDMLICNYVYERVSEHKQRVMNYHGAMPMDQFFTWSDIIHFKPSQYILMHSVFYRTQLLKDCGLKLPKHTFYVDNIFVYEPLPQVKTMYYMDVDFYRYFIGRNDQSVNEQVMISRIDQQIFITKYMINCHDLSQIRNKKLRGYMLNYLMMMLIISTVLLLRSGTEENEQKKTEMWEYLKNTNPRMYRMVRHKFLGRSMFMHGKAGHKLIVLGYRAARKIYGFS